jgi:ketosteroid isomerase-like protein
MRAPTVLRLALSCGVVLAGCARSGTMSPAERRGVATAIEQDVKAAYDFSKPDVERRLLSLYPDTGRVVSAATGRVLTSRDSVAAGIRYFWQNVGVNMRNPRWIWDQMVIDVLAPDAAVMTATYHIPHLTPKGEPHVLGGAWTAVFQRRGGRWLIVQEHLSDLPPQMAMSMK